MSDDDGAKDAGAALGGLLLLVVGLVCGVDMCAGRSVQTIGTVSEIVLTNDGGKCRCQTVYHVKGTVNGRTFDLHDEWAYKNLKKGERVRLTAREGGFSGAWYLEQIEHEHLPCMCREGEATR